MSSAESTELGYVSDVIPDTESEKLPVSDDNDYETETEDSVEEVESESEDEYDEAIRRYAELLTNVPQDKFIGIVDTIEGILTGDIKLTEHNANEGDSIVFAVLIAGMVVLIATILGVEFGTKTNFPFL